MLVLKEGNLADNKTAKSKDIKINKIPIILLQLISEKVQNNYFNFATIKVNGLPYIISAFCLKKKCWESCYVSVIPKSRLSNIPATFEPKAHWHHENLESLEERFRSLGRC